MKCKAFKCTVGSVVSKQTSIINTCCNHKTFLKLFFPLNNNHRHSFTFKFSLVCAILPLLKQWNRIILSLIFMYDISLSIISCRLACYLYYSTSLYYFLIVHCMDRVVFINVSCHKYQICSKYFTVMNKALINVHF